MKTKTQKVRMIKDSLEPKVAERLAIEKERLATVRAFKITLRHARNTFCRLEKYLIKRPSRQNLTFKLLSVALAQAYKRGVYDGSRKCWQVLFEMGRAPKITASVYIKAVEVTKVAENAVEADGVLVNVPGVVVLVRVDGES